MTKRRKPAPKKGKTVKKVKRFFNDKEHRSNLLAYYFKETPYRLWMQWRHNKVPAVFSPMDYKYSQYIERGSDFEILDIGQSVKIDEWGPEISHKNWHETYGEKTEKFDKFRD